MSVVRETQGDFKWRPSAPSIKTKPATYNGSIKTLSLNVKAAQMRKVERENEQGPRLPHLLRRHRIRRRLEQNLSRGQ